MTFQLSLMSKMIKLHRSGGWN